MFSCKSRQKGSGRLRCEYEMNIKDVQSETNEVIPRRDQRAVEAIERSGRTLRRTIKPSKFSVPLT